MIFLNVSQVYNELADTWRPCCTRYRRPARLPFSEHRAALALAAQRLRKFSRAALARSGEAKHPRPFNYSRLDRQALEWLIARGFRSPSERSALEL